MKIADNHNMRTFLVFVVSAFFLTDIYSQQAIPFPPESQTPQSQLASPKKLDSFENVPELLQGIWQGSDRLVLFGDENNNFCTVLRTYYQWYDDRAAEPASYKQLKSRDRNNATSTNGEDIDIQYVTIVENASKTAGVYELKVKYPLVKDIYSIPVAVINGNIYLDFLIKDKASFSDNFESKVNPQDYSVVNTSSNNYQNDTLILRGFYRDGASAKGITVSPPVYKKELMSYFVDGDNIYHIRYWKSSMEYTYEQAVFSDGDKEFFVDKFLRVGGELYQCTTGRSKKIRNIKKSSRFVNYSASDSEGIIIALDKPYLTAVPGKTNWDHLMEMVDENNARHIPRPKPLFPVTFPKYHWKEISEIELYNPKTWNKRNIDIHK